MKRKLLAILVVFAITFALAACGAGKETTLTGMVVSVDGTVISLVEMDADSMQNKDFAEGERPEMPEDMEGMENFQGFGDFRPEDFDGTMPEGENPPQWENGEMPEGMTPPEGMTLPEDGSMPEFDGDMPNFEGQGGMGPGFENFAADADTKELDIGDAHISVEIDGGKESGSLDSIKAGTFVTVTMNGKGAVTNVLVSSQSFFGGVRRPAN